MTSDRLFQPGERRFEVVDFPLEGADPVVYRFPLLVAHQLHRYFPGSAAGKRTFVRPPWADYRRGVTVIEGLRRIRHSPIRIVALLFAVASLAVAIAHDVPEAQRSGPETVLMFFGGLAIIWILGWWRRFWMLPKRRARRRLAE